jgi:hypothetical protein
MTLSAWTRSCSDKACGEVVREAIRSWPAASAFAEGAQDEDWIPPVELAERLERLWLFRIFGEWGELAGRRAAWTGEGAWMLRWIAAQASQGDSWEAPVVLEEGVERTLVLLGSAMEDGLFSEGQRFRDPFAHPVKAGKDNRAGLVVAEHMVADGHGPVVRWVRFSEVASGKGGSHGG